MLEVTTQVTTEDMDSSTPRPEEDANAEEDAMAILKLFHEVESLKRLPRAGWVIKNVEKPESVADHSHRLAFMALFAPVNLNRQKVVEMALVHDLGETYAGDITPHDNIPKELKHEQEKLFFEWQVSTLPGHPAPQRMMELWKEYEERKTPEAIWLHDADIFESVVQAQEYRDRGFSNLEEFTNLIPSLCTAQIQAWAKALTEETKQKDLLRPQIPVIFVTGLPGIGQTAHCRRLEKEFDGHYLSMEDLLLRKATNPHDRHGAFAALYLKEGLDISPVGFMIDILRDNIDQGVQEGKSCIILDNFPRNSQQLRRFEEQIQKQTLTLLLSNPDDIGQRRAFKNFEDQLDGNLIRVDFDNYESIREVVREYIKAMSI